MGRSKRRAEEPESTALHVRSISCKMDPLEKNGRDRQSSLCARCWLTLSALEADIAARRASMMMLEEFKTWVMSLSALEGSCDIGVDISKCEISVSAGDRQQGDEGKQGKCGPFFVVRKMRYCLGCV